ncbi:MAG: histidine kinase [Eggerthellaceae bacterium]|nr:histidine kinase [Eggerthellaceae bacterium]
MAYSDYKEEAIRAFNEYIAKSAESNQDDRAVEKATFATRVLSMEVFVFTIAALSIMVLIATILTPNSNTIVMAISAIVLVISILAVARLLSDPETIRARQSDAILKLASQMLDSVREGLNEQAAARVCNMLLSSTRAVGILITDTEKVLGCAGTVYCEGDATGKPIPFDAIDKTISDGEMRILESLEREGFKTEQKELRSAIIVPLYTGKDTVGSFVYFYKKSRQITETQISVAEGFGNLLSTELAAVAMEEQAKLATSMKLKALQGQINPHFLFNTINTIASLTRTDPTRARRMLREFSVFYRRTLEDNQDVISLEREVEQTQRYFLFEIARFGEERVELVCDVDDEVAEVSVPPFLIQPFVENSVQHALPVEGKLTVTIEAKRVGDDVVIKIIDNGLGMSESARENILHPIESTGMGIAVSNVNERIISVYGHESKMDVQSALGKGTTVTLLLRQAASTKDPL